MGMYAAAVIVLLVLALLIPKRKKRRAFRRDRNLATRNMPIANELLADEPERKRK